MLVVCSDDVAAIPRQRRRIDRAGTAATPQEALFDLLERVLTETCFFRLMLECFGPLLEVNHNRGSLEGALFRWLRYPHKKNGPASA
jgi:hypothetical protein